MVDYNAQEPRSATADKLSTVVRYVSYPLGLITGGAVADVSVRNHIYKNFISRGFFHGKYLTREAVGVREESDKIFQKTVYDALKQKHDAGTKLSKVSEDVIYHYERAHNEAAIHAAAEADPTLKAVLKEAGSIEEAMKSSLVKTQVKLPFPKPTFASAKVIIAEDVVKEVGKNPSQKIHKLINDVMRTEVRGFFVDLGIKNPIDYWKTINRNQKVEAAVLGFTGAAITIGALLAIADHKGLISKLFPDKNQDPAPSR